MLTKAFAALGLTVLIASGPAYADSCDIDVRGNDNVVNCTIVKNSTRHYHYDETDDYQSYPVVQPQPYFVPGPYVMGRPMMMGPRFIGGMGRPVFFGRR